MTPDTILDVQRLTTVFDTRDGRVVAVDDMSFAISRGETVGLVGESGCGKTMTALSIMGLLPFPGHVESGRILFQGEDLLAKSPADMRRLRGNRIAMVFQEPLTALNPVFTIESQLLEVYLHHLDITRREARQRIRSVLSRVGITETERVLRAYPHQISGGMRQRVLIATALACIPDVLIADEPTTAIDSTIQRQILRLIDSLRAEFGMAVLMITHDLGVVSEACDRVAVMYASRIVETAPVREIFHTPSHPYTIGLLRSLPFGYQPGQRLSVISGQVPHPSAFPSGCPFHPRCQWREDRCTVEEPALRPVGTRHLAACHRSEDVHVEVPELPVNSC